jgi:ubiquinone/menaquinone biosynthesis C-methylase UbiE
MSNETARFFDTEAAIWPGNYADGGQMVYRIGRFDQAMAGRVPKGAAVLDYGCGSGNITGALAARGFRMTGADISSSMLEAARAHFNGADIPLHSIAASGGLPFADQTFDACISSSVLEYVDDPDFVVGEIARVLKPSGWFFATVPDLRHPIFRRQALITPLARTGLFQAVAGLTRWRKAAVYLRISKNRIPVGRWKAIFDRNGFSIDQIPEAGEPLVMLAARKSGA